MPVVTAAEPRLNLILPGVPVPATVPAVIVTFPPAAPPAAEVELPAVNVMLPAEVAVVTPPPARETSPPTELDPDPSPPVTVTFPPPVEDPPVAPVIVMLLPVWFVALGDPFIVRAVVVLTAETFVIVCALNVPLTSKSPLKTDTPSVDEIPLDPLTKKNVSVPTD